MNRKYKKSSWVGKIYKWTKGHHYDTDSCSVKKAVLWEAPIKLLFKQKLFYFSPIDENINTWFIWLTALQIYMGLNWSRLLGEAENLMLLEILMLPVFSFAIFVTFFEVIILIILVIAGIVSILGEIMNRISSKSSEVMTPIENRMRAISTPVENYFTEWWDELKNKLCKPVTWVE